MSGRNVFVGGFQDHVFLANGSMGQPLLVWICALRQRARTADFASDNNARGRLEKCGGSVGLEPEALKNIGVYRNLGNGAARCHTDSLDIARCGYAFGLNDANRHHHWNH